MRHHIQMRFDPYLNVDEGWDDSTDQLVTELFMLAGDASKELLEMYYRIAILRSKVRPDTCLKIVNAIPLPNTDLTVIQRSEPELGLSVDQERIWDHMPRPAKLDGTDVDTKLLGTLLHWVTPRCQFCTRMSEMSYLCNLGKTRMFSIIMKLSRPIKAP